MRCRVIFHMLYITIGPLSKTKVFNPFSQSSLAAQPPIPGAVREGMAPQRRRAQHVHLDKTIWGAD